MPAVGAALCTTECAPSLSREIVPDPSPAPVVSDWPTTTWAQWLGEVIPVTHFLRVVRGALLKGQDLGNMWRELAALTAFVCVVTALAMARYRRTLD